MKLTREPDNEERRRNMEMNRISETKPKYGGKNERTFLF